MTTEPEHANCAQSYPQRIARSDTIGDLALRLAAVYGNLKNLAEQGWNEYHRFSFVSLGQVTDPVRQAMADAGVVCLPSVTESTAEPWQMKNGTGIKATVTVDFTWIAAESGEWMNTRWTGMALDAGDKAFTKAYSAILKTALMKTFLVSSATADEDPHAASPEEHNHRDQRWDRFELEADIDFLLKQTELGEEHVARFRNYLLEVYGVKSWSEISLQRLAQIRGRLRSLEVDERESTILDKVSVTSDAA